MQEKGFTKRRKGAEKREKKEDAKLAVGLVGGWREHVIDFGVEDGAWAVLGLGAASPRRGISAPNS